VIGTSEASSARVAKLEAEVENLREQLGKAKGINDVMWETVVQKVMTQDKQKAGQNATVSGEGEDVDDVERPRKKGKKTSK
jgi:pre-rRNA-processing protein IPI3